MLKRPVPSQASLLRLRMADAALTPVIDRSFKASDRTYGPRRVWRDVPAEGLACGRHKIERLMRQSALRARPPPDQHKCSSALTLIKAGVRWAQAAKQPGLGRSTLGPMERLRSRRMRAALRRPLRARRARTPPRGALPRS